MITWGILAGADRAGHRRDQLRHRPLPARRRRGRLLPGHRALFHLLVPDLPPCADRLRLSDRAADRGGRRCADFDRAAGPGWLVRPARAGRSCISPRAIPTVLIGIVTLFVLTDRPEQAKFLTAEEKTWLSAKLASERKAKEAVRTFSMLQGMFDPKVLLLALNYFGIVVASLGHAVLRSADHQVDRRHQQHDGRLADDDPLHLRWHRPGGLGPRLRPHERAALEPARRPAWSPRLGWSSPA